MSGSRAIVKFDNDLESIFLIKSKCIYDLAVTSFAFFKKYPQIIQVGLSSCWKPIL